MRFEELRLLAFGPFTDERLDLRGGAPGGLHVIYGPNEAGKSTSLRAVKSFLFGMPRRTPDAHLHPSPRLAVGATVSNDGRFHVLTRLKKNRGDLLDADGNPVAQDPLPALLGYLDENSFSTRFGLDQVELEKGAEALLGGSEQGLFAAGTAGADVRRILTGLDEEAAELFLPRGKLPLLNKQNAAYEQALIEMRRAERPPEKWLLQNKAHQTAVDQVQTLQKKRLEVRGELRRLNRLKAVMSDLLEWQRATSRLEELSYVVQLPPDAFERRLQIGVQITESQAEARRITEDVRSFERELSQLAEVSPLCEIDDEQLNLGARVGTAISARKDLPKRRAALAEQERQIGTMLRDLGRPASPGDELRVARQALAGLKVAGTVGRLVTQYSGLVSTQLAAESRLRKLASPAQDHEELEPGETSEADLERLEALFAEGRAAQALSQQVLQEKKGLAALEGEEKKARSRLACTLPWHQLAELLPRVDYFKEWTQSFKEHKKSLDALQQQRQSLERELSDCKEKSKGQLELPNEADLLRLRNQRDEMLRSPGELVRAELASVLGELDRVTDVLLRDADRVYQARALRLRVLQLEEKVDSLLRQEERETAWLKRAWEEIIQIAGTCGCRSPSGPDDVLGWSGELSRLCDLAQEAESRQRQLSVAESRVNGTVASLRHHLGARALDLELPGLLALLEREMRFCVQRRERHLLLDRDRRQKEQEQKEAVLELEHAREGLDAWKEAWARAVLPLGLDKDVSVERTQEVLGTLQRVERLVEVASNYESRIQGMVRDTEELARDIRRYVQDYLPVEVQREETVHQAIRLQEAIRVARSQKQDRLRLRALIEERRATLSSVEATLKAATDQIQAMLSLARAENEEQLALAERLSNEKRGLQLRAAELLERIRVSSDGAPLDELVAEAKVWDGAVRRLIVRIDELDQTNADLEEELRRAEADAEGTRLGLLSYQTEDVAEIRQRLAERAATARNSLRRFLVLRAAHALLSEQVARYAERFSGPILGRAGELFHRITLGKYSRLSVGLGERSLRCIRQGHEIEVGELSRGTRAQLYFVLRLASLERYFRQHPAVPLIFDDLFVDFDDDRATVAFELLSELAESVQILYFTHLARDVEKAHDAVGPSRLFTHTIGVS